MTNKELESKLKLLFEIDEALDIQVERSEFDGEEKRPEINRRFKERLRQVGERHGFFVPREELLWDQAWLSKDADGDFIGFHLACEIELTKTPKAVECDFRKLLLANADIKVLICR